MPNSKTFVQALLAAFCAILCAGFSPLSGVGGGGMMLGARTAAWAKSGGSLPYDAEVEWLESTGIQYITIPHQSDSKRVLIDAMVAWMGGAGVQTLFHETDSASGSDRVFVNGSTLKWGGQIYGPDAVVGEIAHVEVSIPTGYAKVNGQNTYNNAWYVGSGIDVFATKYTNSVGSFGNFKLYSLVRTIDGNSSEIINVRFTNENGVIEGALYDRVSGQLFRNAGTGAFVIGPDK